MSITINSEENQIKRRRIESLPFANKLEEVATMGLNTLRQEVAIWSGRAVEEIQHAESFPECLALFLDAVKKREVDQPDQLRPIKRHAKILKGLLKNLPAELKNGCGKVLSDLKELLHLLQKPQPQSENLPRALSIWIDSKKSQIDYLWKENHIESFPDPENERLHTLQFSEALQESIDDATLKVILENSDPRHLGKITHFDFFHYPKLGPIALVLMVKACPKLDRSCLRKALESPRFQDHELQAEEKVLPVNKELMKVLIPFLQTLWDSGMKETSGPVTSFRDAEFRAIQTCVQAALGNNDLDNEQDLYVLFSILQQADLWQQKAFSMQVGNRILAILNASDEMLGEKGYELLAHFYKGFMPFFAQKQFPELQESLKRLGTKLIEKEANMAMSVAQVAHSLSQNRPYTLPVEFDERKERFESLIAALKSAKAYEQKYGALPVCSAIAQEVLSAMNDTYYRPFPQKAAEVIELFLSMAPDNDIGHLAKATLHKTQWRDREADIEKALLSFEAAFRVNPSNQQVFLELVDLLRTGAEPLKLVVFLMTANDNPTANPYTSIHLARLLSKGLDNFVVPCTADALAVLDNTLKAYEALLERQPKLKDDYEKVLSYKLVLMMQEANEELRHKRAIVGLELLSKFRLGILNDFAENNCVSEDPFTHVCIIAFFKYLATIGDAKMLELVIAREKENRESKAKDTFQEFMQYMPKSDLEYANSSNFWTQKAKTTRHMVTEIFQDASGVPVNRPILPWDVGA